MLHFKVTGCFLVGVRNDFLRYLLSFISMTLFWSQGISQELLFRKGNCGITVTFFPKAKEVIQMPSGDKLFVFTTEHGDVQAYVGIHPYKKTANAKPEKLFDDYVNRRIQIPNTKLDGKIRLTQIGKNGLDQRKYHGVEFYAKLDYPKNGNSMDLRGIAYDDSQNQQIFCVYLYGTTKKVNSVAATKLLQSIKIGLPPSFQSQKFAEEIKGIETSIEDLKLRIRQTEARILSWQRSVRLAPPGLLRERAQRNLSDEQQLLVTQKTNLSIEELRLSNLRSRQAQLNNK